MAPMAPHAPQGLHDRRQRGGRRGLPGLPVDLLAQGLRLPGGPQGERQGRLRAGVGELHAVEPRPVGDAPAPAQPPGGRPLVPDDPVAAQRPLDAHAGRLPGRRRVLGGVGQVAKALHLLAGHPDLPEPPRRRAWRALRRRACRSSSSATRRSAGRPRRPPGRPSRRPRSAAGRARSRCSPTRRPPARAAGSAPSRPRCPRGGCRGTSWSRSRRSRPPGHRRSSSWRASRFRTR